MAVESWSAARERYQDREFAPGMSGDSISGAQGCREPSTDRGDQFIGGVVSVSAIYPRQIVEADDQNRERGDVRRRLAATLVDHLIEGAPGAECALDQGDGWPIRVGLRARRPRQHPQYAVDAARTAGAVGEPATEILDFVKRALGRGHSIRHAKRDALALVAGRPVMNDVKAGRFGVASDARGESGAGGERGPGEARQRRLDVRTPSQSIGRDVPIVDDRIDRRQDRDRIGVGARRRCSRIGPIERQRFFQRDIANAAHAFGLSFDLWPAGVDRTLPHGCAQLLSQNVKSGFR